MRRSIRAFALVFALFAAADAGEGETGMEQVVWDFDNLERIGGHRVTVIGEPRVIETPGGKAVEFDGENDALFLDVHPLAGAGAFTEEIIFKPYSDGRPEQRFFHLQEDGSEDRVLFETRLTGDGQWFLDTFIKSGEGNYAQLARDFKHPLDAWYHLALVVDGKQMRHYVNGKLELSREVAFSPQGEGRTSVGVRINMVHWFKGAVRKARFTRRALSPEEFLKP